MDNVYVRSAEIVRRMKLEMPLHLTLNDPVTGDPITMSRANILELLVVESHNLFLEGQTIAALHAECLRFSIAAEFASARAEAEYRKWKSRMGHEFRAACAKKKPVKKPTVAEAETFYRMHDDYDKYHDEPHRLKAVASLLSGLCRSFTLKGRVVSDQSNALRGHESALRVEETTDRLEVFAARVASDISTAAAESDMAGSIEELNKALSGKKPNARTARTLED